MMIWKGHVRAWKEITVGYVLNNTQLLHLVVVAGERGNFDMQNCALEKETP